MKKKQVVQVQEKYVLSEDEIKQFENAFLAFDEDGDQTISAKELYKVFKEMDVKKSMMEIKEMIQGVDEDGSGAIDKEEYLEMMRQTLEKDQIEFTDEDYFQIFDRDGNGTISDTEICHVLEQLGQPITNEIVDSMIEKYDQDNDRKIDIDEFKDMMSYGKKGTQGSQGVRTIPTTRVQEEEVKKCLDEEDNETETLDDGQDDGQFES